MDRLILSTPGGLLTRDARGVVYVEFLFAFLPVFLLFLAVCQLSLLASAELVVRHAALAAARSAIVVLEEPPNQFAGAPRGSLSAGQPRGVDSVEALLASMGLAASASSADNGGASGGASGGARAIFARQQGARMGPVRSAAYVPLLALAPTQSSVAGEGSGNLGRSLLTGLQEDLHFAIDFTRAASSVTVHSAPGSDPLAQEPIGPKDPVTVRVSYLVHCAVPLVRALVCTSAAELMADLAPGLMARLAPGRTSRPRNRLRHAESPDALSRLVSGRAYFMMLSAEVTLPNQGALYYVEEES